MFFVGITISEMRKERIKFDSMHVIELLFILIGWPIPIGYAVYLTITNPYDL